MVCHKQSSMIKMLTIVTIMVTSLPIVVLSFSTNSPRNPNLFSINCSTNYFKCFDHLMRNELKINKSCVDQKYFDSVRGQCIDCNHCPVNSRTEHHCNASHDTQCVCNPGFFMTTDLNCKPCSQCDSGWGIWRTCRGSRNTVCRKCPPGTFSGAQTGTLGCILCTKCNSSQVLLKECSGVHDSICLDRRTFESQNLNEDEFNEEANALPIFIALMSFVILVLIVYVIIQLRIKRFIKSKTNPKTVHNFKPSVAYHNLYNNCVYDKNRFNYCNRLVENSKLSNNNCIDSNQKQNCGIRYNQMNTFVRRTFEINLNRQSDSWKKLAKELGYSSESVGRFECLGQQTMNCVQYFLTDWSKREDATIDALLQALTKIGRIDCVLIIDSSFLSIYKLNNYSVCI